MKGGKGGAGGFTKGGEDGESPGAAQMDNRKSIIMALTDAGGVGPRIFQQLMMRLGDPENLLNATASDLADIPRLGEPGSAKILKALDDVGRFRNRLENYTEMGIGVSTYLDDDYPPMLRQIDDPPPVLFMVGDRTVLKHDFVALVGTTQATEAGLRLAVELARGFVERGFGIASGLATGIDSAAHLGALKSNGPTVAVLGSGVMNVFPEENRPLAESIAEKGLLVSEYDPFKKVKAIRLILRNRLISAFSKAVIVVQVGAKRRGELRTAQYAYKQAKPLFFADPEGDLDFETLEGNKGLLIKGSDSIDEIVNYMV
jgi:DNA processing protein